MSDRKKRISSLLFRQLFTLGILLMFLFSIIVVESHGVNSKTVLSVQTTPTSLPQREVKDPFSIKKVNADDINEDYCVTVPVLLYHHVQPLYLASENQQETLTVGVEFFDMQMKYLSDNGYVSLSATQLVKALLNREELPTKSVVITFDDGYEDNYLYAYPVLRRYGIMGNFMVATSLLETEGYMNWTQLAEMAESNLVSIYNHTAHHVDIGNATKEQSLGEIVQAKDALEKKLGINSPIFAYPYGSVSETAREALKFTGYAGAFTTQHGFLQCRSQLLDLHRDHIGNAPLSSYGL